MGSLPTLNGRESCGVNRILAFGTSPVIQQKGKPSYSQKKAMPQSRPSTSARLYGGRLNNIRSICLATLDHYAGNPSNAGSPSSDRKSTRLNSSHAKISYAVFCLK